MNFDGSVVKLVQCPLWDYDLQNTGGNEVLLKEVVQEFPGESPILLTNAEQAVAEGDTETLRTQAHS